MKPETGMCSVVGCDSYRRNAQRLKLPEDPEKRLQWVQFVLEINGQQLKESSWTDVAICSEHFTSDCFINTNPEAGAVQLRPGAVPSVCIKSEPGEPAKSPQHVELAGTPCDDLRIENTISCSETSQDIAPEAAPPCLVQMQEKEPTTEVNQKMDIEMKPETGMCSVVGCDSYRRNAQRLKLPEDPEKRLQWVQFVLEVNGQQLKESSWTDVAICSEHFTSDCFINTNPEAGAVQLRPGAVPSVCIKSEPGEPAKSPQHVEPAGTPTFDETQYDDFKIESTFPSSGTSQDSSPDVSEAAPSRLVVTPTKELKTEVNRNISTSTAIMTSGLPTSAATCQTGRKRRPDLWTHFCYLPAQRKTECIVLNEHGERCGYKISGKNTTNLKRHLKIRHPVVSDKLIMATRRYNSINNKRNTLTMEQRVHVIQMLDNGKTCRSIAATIGCGRTQINRISQQRETIMAEWMEGTTRADRKYVKRRKTVYEDLNQLVYDWFIAARTRNLPLSGSLIQEKALLLAEEMGHDDFTASNGWLECWLKRYNIRLGVLCGEGADVPQAVIDDWTRRLPEITAGFSPCDVFNADETALFYRALPSRSYVFKADPAKGPKSPKERVTVLLACAASGEKLTPLVIGNSAQPRCFRSNKSILPVIYKDNKKAFMTSLIFTEWLDGLNNQMRGKGRHILLLVDNCGAHPHVERSNVKLVFLPPNTTSRLQPCGAGIIQAVKANYRKLLLRHILSEMDEATSPQQLTGSVTIRDAISWLDICWDLLQPVTIRRCFAKCGFPTPADQPSTSDQPAISDQPSTSDQHSFSSGASSSISREILQTASELECELGPNFRRLMRDVSWEDFINMDSDVATNERTNDWEQEIIQRAKGVPTPDSEDEESKPEPERLPRNTINARTLLTNSREAVHFAFEVGSERILRIARELVSAVEDYCLQQARTPAVQPSITDVCSPRGALLRTKGKFVVNEKCLFQLVGRRCPSCGSKLQIEKVTYEAFLVLNLQCLQCDYRNRWKNVADANIPAPGERRLTEETSENQQAESPACKSAVVSEMVVFSDEESDDSEDVEEVDEDEVSTDGEWNPTEDILLAEELAAYSDEDSGDDVECLDPQDGLSRELCAECGAFFDKRKHHTCVHKEKPFSCNICGKRCMTEASLQIHSRIHKDNYEHRCKYCYAPFKTRVDKLKHEDTHQNTKDPYICPDCPQTFATRKERSVHLVTHRGPNEHKCGVCGLIFKGVHSLRRHSLVHTGVKPHQCSVCDRRFTQPSHLKSHMRLHTGERPFRCRHCGKSFNHNVSLKAHFQRDHASSRQTPLESSNDGHDAEDENKTDPDVEFDGVEEEEEQKVKTKKHPKRKNRSTGRPIGRPKKTAAEGSGQEKEGNLSNTAKSKRKRIKKSISSDEEQSDENVSFESAEEDEEEEAQKDRIPLKRTKQDSDSDFNPEEEETTQRKCSSQRGGKSSGKPRGRTRKSVMV